MNVTNATTDPRLLKQLLMTQWMTAIDPLSSETSAVGGSDSPSLFDMLLGQMLGTDTTGANLAGAQGGLSLDSINSLLGGLGADSSGSSLGGSSSTLAALSYSLPGSAGLQLSGALNGSTAGFSSAYDGLISAAAVQYGVDPALIKAVIQSESSFNANAVSGSGAKGLMQLMDGTARDLGVSDSFDPAQNIDGGTRYLSYLMRKYEGSVQTALAAYNAGPGRVDSLGIAGEADLAARYETLPSETQSYVRKVVAALGSWS